MLESTSGSSVSRKPRVWLSFTTSGARKLTRSLIEFRHFTCPTSPQLCGASYLDSSLLSSFLHVTTLGSHEHGVCYREGEYLGYRVCESLSIYDLNAIEMILKPLNQRSGSLGVQRTLSLAIKSLRIKDSVKPLSREKVQLPIFRFNSLDEEHKGWGGTEAHSSALAGFQVGCAIRRSG